MTILTITLCIICLVILISWGKINAFLAFLIVSIVTGILLGIPISQVSLSVQKGIGDTLGGLVIVISLGAMLGKLVAETGAAQQIASTMMKIFGVKYIQWALMATGFIVGIPLFYNVGFVLMIPLIFSVVYQYKLPAVYIGLPMLASLSVTHGFLPPHPAPTALVSQFKANMGLTLFYGMIVAIPSIIIAGPVFSRTLKKIVAIPLKTFEVQTLPIESLPGKANSFLSSLLPVILLMATTLFPIFLPATGPAHDIAMFFGDPNIVMLISLIVATYTLGIMNGKSMMHLMNFYSDAVKDISMIIFIVAGAGALKQVFVDSGVSDEIATILQKWDVHPLFLGWLIASIIRVCIGSATVAGLTTAGIMAPILLQSGADPNLMVLSIGAGSLMFSHVNDGGFWMFKEYFNLSMKDTLRSWSVMESIVAVVGLIGVMTLNAILHQ